MKSRHLLAAVLSAATCVVFAGETAYPLYTVTVAAGITNNLDDATVSVISEAGGAAADVAFSALSGSITTGTFRKRGMGALRSSSGMGSFSGEARIEEGVLIIDNVGQLGPCVEKSKTDPLVVVSNGASIVVAYDGLPTDESKKNMLRFCGGLQIAGEGFGGIGAIRSENTQRNNYMFSSSITLNGDTLLVNDSKAAETTDKVWGVEALKNCNLNGHTLTMAGGPFRDYRMTFTNPGHVVVAEDADFWLYSYYQDWVGDASNTFTVKSGGRLRFDLADTCIKSPWTLVLEDGAKLYSTIQSTGTNSCCWSGPVRLEGRIDATSNGKDCSLPLLGPISGDGELYFGRGRLHLASDASTFSGGVRAYSTKDATPPVLCLWSPKALPSPFVSTNANLNLSAPVAYDLPALTFHAVAGKTLTASGGAGGVAASLVKTGPGLLELVSPLAVTGGVTLAGGTLRLSSDISPYSPAPGLIESKYIAADQTEHDAIRPAWYRDGTAMNTNRVVAFPELAEKRRDMDPGSWDEYQFVRYTGYIWNRSDEDVTWTFAVSICPQNQLYIDDQLVVSHTSTATDANFWKVLLPTTITLSPGHHSFDLRLDSTKGYVMAGARGSQSTNGLNWPETGLGFAIDFQGRGSLDANCYAVPSNNVLGSVCGGDGALFTVDTRTRADGGADFSRASFPRLTAAPGTVLDLNAPGCTFEVKELSGITAVSNGSLRVTEKWTLSNGDVVSGKPLEAEEGISFAPGWTLDIPDLGSIVSGKRRTLAVSESGGLTLPASFVCGADTPGRWHLELFDGGTRLELVSGGFRFIIK